MVGTLKPGAGVVTAQKERCERCRYWENLDRRHSIEPPNLDRRRRAPTAAADDETGICRRFPPSFTGTASAIPARARGFPITVAADWCGEFRG